MQLDVAYLGVAMEPHVVDRRLSARRGAAHLGPEHELANIHGEHGAGVLRYSIHHTLGDD